MEIEDQYLSVLSQDPVLLGIVQQCLELAQADGSSSTHLASQIHTLLYTPQDILKGHLLEPAAEYALAHYPKGLPGLLRATPVPWRQWGGIDVDVSAIAQMENACLLPNAVRGALMPDAHTGYGLPIGGVLAVEGAVIPYAVGVDIACRMRLTVLDMPPSALKTARSMLVYALEQETRFGVGASFEQITKREHPVLDEDWSFSAVAEQNKNLAWSQLGSSGAGNHFVEFGELHCEFPVHMGTTSLEKGIYLALLSHSGSRGTGEKIANFYSRLAMLNRPYLPKIVQHLAWFDMDSHIGQEYWQAMHLMGRYAAANHELIHHHILRAIGAEAVATVENHHNFAWEEECNGKKVVVHRKGATPAHKGTQGIIPGSMAAPGFIVSGKGNAEALDSCSHGAGRLMSRSEAARRFTHDDIQQRLEKKGIELLSGGLDEAPMAYKDIHAVMEAQKDLVDILARFEPRIVKMAPDKKRRKPRRRKRTKK